MGVDVALSALGRRSVCTTGRANRCPIPTTIRRFDVESLDLSGVRIVLVHGEIDMVTAGELTGHLDEAGEMDDIAVVADLCEVTFMDSSGLGALLRAQRALRETEVPMAVACVPHGPLARLFQISALDGVLDVYDDRDQAMTAVLRQ
jgi:anti-sigma B factor antagonist